VSESGRRGRSSRIDKAFHNSKVNFQPPTPCASAILPDRPYAPPQKQPCQRFPGIGRDRVEIARRAKGRGLEPVREGRTEGCAQGQGHRFRLGAGIPLRPPRVRQHHRFPDRGESRESHGRRRGCGTRSRRGGVRGGTHEIRRGRRRQEDHPFQAPHHRQGTRRDDGAAAPRPDPGSHGDGDLCRRQSGHRARDRRQGLRKTRLHL